MDQQPGYKEGWLNKRGHINKGWRERWFVLSPAEKILYYYKSDKDYAAHKKPQGEIDVSIHAVRTLRPANPFGAEPHGLQLTYLNTEKIFYLASTDESKLQSWTEAISKVGIALPVPQEELNDLEAREQRDKQRKLEAEEREVAREMEKLQRKFDKQEAKLLRKQAREKQETLRKQKAEAWKLDTKFDNEKEKIEMASVEELEDLKRKQAYELTDMDWKNDDDMLALVTKHEKIVDKKKEDIARRREVYLMKQTAAANAIPLQAKKRKQIAENQRKSVLLAAAPVAAAVPVADQAENQVGDDSSEGGRSDEKVEEKNPSSEEVLQDRPEERGVQDTNPFVHISQPREVEQTRVPDSPPIAPAPVPAPVSSLEEEEAGPPIPPREDDPTPPANIEGGEGAPAAEGQEFYWKI